LERAAVHAMTLPRSVLAAVARSNWDLELFNRVQRMNAMAKASTSNGNAPADHSAALEKHVKGLTDIANEARESDTVLAETLDSAVRRLRAAAERVRGGEGEK
jgi:hypothetical protein